MVADAKMVEYHGQPHVESYVLTIMNMVGLRAWGRGWERHGGALGGLQGLGGWAPGGRRQERFRWHSGGSLGDAEGEGRAGLCVAVGTGMLCPCPQGLRCPPSGVRLATLEVCLSGRDWEKPTHGWPAPTPARWEPDTCPQVWAGLVLSEGSGGADGCPGRFPAPCIALGVASSPGAERAAPRAGVGTHVRVHTHARVQWGAPCV